MRTYGEIVHRTLQRVDRKRLNADGSEPTCVMRGVTIPRPVYVQSVTPIGKELTVDPADTDEDTTAEMLSATALLEYRDTNETFDVLRGAVKELGVARVSREAEVSRSIVRAFVNQGTIPHAATIAKLQTALERLGS